MAGITARFSTRLGGFELAAEFDAPAQGVTALFGHSGSGKTTVLRCMAGLERADDGYLEVNGEIWQDGRRFLPTHKRPIGYVFQEASLFSHLTVRRNLEYGFRRVSPDKRRVRFDDAVELLGIARLLERRPSRLSGGERQRVAIARALLTSPKLLLMDEPLSALDAISKADILPYLERLHRELSIPVVYVSHSRAEVARLADYMVWMAKGRVQQSGPTSRILPQIALPSESSDEEAVSIVSTRVAEHDDEDELTALDCAWGRLWVRRLTAAPGSPVKVELAASDIALATEAPVNSSVLNVWRARVVSLQAGRKGEMLVHLAAPADESAAPVLARLTRRSVKGLGLEPGSDVYALIKSVAVVA